MSYIADDRVQQTCVQYNVSTSNALFLLISCIFKDSMSFRHPCHPNALLYSIFNAISMLIQPWSVFNYVHCNAETHYILKTSSLIQAIY